MSKETSFTPGPWKAKFHAAKDEFEITDDSRQMFIAKVYGYDADAQRDANANLIAAAPDMYEALEYTKSILDSLIEQFGWDEKNLVNVARAKCKSALSKAQVGKL